MFIENTCRNFCVYDLSKVQSILLKSQMIDMEPENYKHAVPPARSPIARTHLIGSLSLPVLTHVTLEPRTDSSHSNTNLDSM